MKKVTVVLTSAGALLQLIAVIIYGATGINAFSATLSPAVFVFGVLFILLAAFAAVLILTGILKPFSQRFLGTCLYLVFLAGLVTLLLYIVEQINYLASIFVGIDGTKLTASFVLAVLAFVLSMGCALAASVTCNRIETQAVQEEVENEKAD